MPRDRSIVLTEHPVPAGSSFTPEVEQILDAAFALFADIGVRRATIGDIARRAHIDRVTVYRRIGSKDDVVQAVIARDAAALFDLVMQAARRPDTLEDRVAVAFATVITQLRANALLASLLNLEPETLLPRLTTEAMPLLATAVAATMHMLDQAVQDGLLESTEGMLASAEVLVRVVHSYLLTPQVLVKLTTYDELIAFAHTHLVPMLKLVS